MTTTIQIEGMDELIEAVGSGGGGGGGIVPTPTAQDEGKVLTASDDGTASWEEAQGGGGLPEIHGDIDAGKVVTAGWSVASGTGSYSLESIRQVPDASSETSGKVLTTNSWGGYGWQTPSGGGGGGSTIYSKVCSVYHDEKSGENFIEILDDSITRATRVLAMLSPSTGEVLSVGDYSVNVSSGSIYIYLNNAIYEQYEVIFATTTVLS